MFEKKLYELLSQFGLTEGQISVYVAIRMGEARTASEIADETDVSRRSVYRMCDELERRDLITINRAVTPTTFRPQLSALVYRNNERRLRELWKALNEHAPARRDYDLVTHFTSRASIEHVSEVIQRAEREVRIAIPADVYPEVTEAVESVHDDGVFVRLVLGESGSNPERSRFVEEAAAHVVRTSGDEASMVCTVDENYAVLGDGKTFRQGVPSDGITLFTDPTMVWTAIGLFGDQRWDGATERRIADPPALPAVRESFKHAILNVWQYRDTGQSVTAQCRAVPADGGEPTLLSGTVQDVWLGFVETEDERDGYGFTLATDTGTVSVYGRRHAGDRYAVRSPVQIDRAGDSVS